MTYNHTPRIWQVDRDHQTRTATDPITICAGSPDFPETWQFVAEVQGCGELGEQERDANARLIAAAPELLKAAHELLCWAESVDGKQISPNITATPDSIFTQARAAIAKARGES